MAITDGINQYLASKLNTAATKVVNTVGTTTTTTTTTSDKVEVTTTDSVTGVTSISSSTIETTAPENVVPENSNDGKEPADPPAAAHAWFEPASVFNEDAKYGPTGEPIYGRNQVFEFGSGSAMHFDDTPAKERIRLEHKSKTFLEIHPDGKQVNKIQNNNYLIVLGDNNVKISGKCTVEIEGNVQLNIKGNLVERVEGDYTLEVAGNYTRVVGKETRISSGEDYSVTAGGVLGTGVIYFNSHDRVHMFCDLSVDGVASATDVVADYKVTAGTQVESGFLGFISKTGGLFLGLPASIPGNPLGEPPYSLPGIVVNGTMISTTGFILSTQFVGAPIIAGLYVRDLLGSMMGIRFEHNLHFHPAPFGLTGFPFFKMFGTLL
jgi:hypothetical protein